MEEIKRKVLSVAGYQKLNELNDKYNISFCEISDTEEFWEWSDNFLIVNEHSCIMEEEDVKWVLEMRNTLDR